MVSENLPEEILKFLESSIDSVEQLRVLLLLHSDPEREWSTAEITKELRSADSSIEQRLNALYDREVLVRLLEPGRHKFTPSSEEIRKNIQQLEQVNQSKPYRVIDAIYSRRANALDAFVDAFKFKGDK